MSTRTRTRTRTTATPATPATVTPSGTGPRPAALLGFLAFVGLVLLAMKIVIEIGFPPQ